MSDSRKLAAILAADVVGYSRLAGADEDRILARLRALRSDLIDPTIAVHHGRVVKRTGDGALVEFRSAVVAVRCAVEVQNALEGLLRSLEAVRELRQASALGAELLEPAWYQYRGEVAGLDTAIQAVRRRLR